ncbi:MAG: hypothetical protein MRT15_11315 [archaeon YNP-LCB-003-016]|uniref:hypothetical protein n=1 Tax=Candidatus Culexarchaeum yellowstonense TaxID=2928963 RepID=UPI0026EB8E94|nr:hypothetical protein [Candidatus Culexarchaeum yellowstonense]MCR6692972.1 hypothetical protein [Candidatus Culexarchaeum yellowstonense]
MGKMIEVIVKDRDGKIVKREAINEDLYNEYIKRMSEKPFDLSTRWFLRVLFAIFQPGVTSGKTTVSFTDTTGTARTQDFKASFGTTYNSFFNMVSCNNRLWITYGSGTTSPTRDDYKLVNKISEGLAGVTADETQGTLTFSASFTMTSDITIYEVGLEWEACVSGYSTCGRVLLDRTVFANGIIVKAGQTVTFIYRFFL